MTTNERHQIQTALCRLAEATNSIRLNLGRDHNQVVLELDTITHQTLQILDITVQGGAK